MQAPPLGPIRDPPLPTTNDHVHALVCPEHREGRGPRHYHHGDAWPRQAPGVSAPSARSHTLKRHGGLCEATQALPQGHPSLAEATVRARGQAPLTQLRANVSACLTQAAWAELTGKERISRPVLVKSRKA